MGQIRSVGYEPASPAGGPIEMISLHSLRRRWRDSGAPLLRGDFYVLGLIERGAGHMLIDFAQLRLRPHAVVLARPGAVHQWHDIENVSATLVLFTSTVATRSAYGVIDDLDGATLWTPPPRDRALVAGAAVRMRRELAAADEASLATTPLLLSALLHRLAPPISAAATTSEVFLRFRRRVERDFRHHHDLAHYAAQLGYSVRTLTRAAHAATGASAKSYITARIVLEARRLLAHDRLSAARCAIRLGFDDPSNFSAFFLRETGERPGAWRESH